MKLLFFDDYHLQYRHNLEFIAHQPEKHPANPVLVPEHPWEAWRAFPIANCVMQDNDIFRMWYETGYDELSVSGERINRTAYATSTDGLNWEKPVLNQYDYKGNTENNILNFGPFGVHNVSVVRDVEDINPYRGYKMTFFTMPPGKGRGELPSGINVAVSEDGLRWRLARSANEPAFRAWRDVVPGQPSSGDTHALVGYVPERQRHVVMTRNITIVPYFFRTICYSESTDFINWSEPVNVLSPDEQDIPGTEFYYLTVQRYEDLYLGHLCVFHNYSRRRTAANADRFRVSPELAYMNQRLDTKLVYSRDLQVWRYADRQRRAFIPVGDPDTWDSGMIFGASMVEIGNEHWYYYGGTPMRHIVEDLQYAGTERDGLPMTMCGGVARLRQDGFVSLHAGEAEGECIMQAITIADTNSIHLNARTLPNGTVTIQILEEDADEVIATSMPFVGDDLSAQMQFDQGLPQNSRVRLRIISQHADVFSIRV